MKYLPWRSWRRWNCAARGRGPEISSNGVGAEGTGWISVAMTAQKSAVIDHAVAWDAPDEFWVAPAALPAPEEVLALTMKRDVLGDEADEMVLPAALNPAIRYP